MTTTTKNRDMSEKPLSSQPFSQQAENAIIAAILHDPEVIVEVLEGRLQSEHFYDSFCSAVYAKARQLALAKETIDVVYLAGRLDGLAGEGEAEIADRLDNIYSTSPTKLNLDGWVSIVTDRWAERQMAIVGKKLCEMAHIQDVPVTDKVAESHRLMSVIGNVMTENTILSTTEMVASALEEVENSTRSGGHIVGIRSGLKALDNLIPSFRAGDLVVIGARPSMGKTSLALTIAEYSTMGVPVAERKKALMFSMEMDQNQMGMRWLSTLYDIPLANLRGGTIAGDDYGRLSSALDDSVDSGFYLETTGKTTLESLAAKARRHKREHGLDAIWIDYLQLITPSSLMERASANQQVAHVSRGLKLLGMELKVPVFALSQLNRSLEMRQDKRPMMSDLRESGAIEQDADVIMFLYRDVVYNKNTQNPDEAEIIVAKHRNGPTGTAKLHFKNSTTLFQDLKSKK